MNPRKALTLLRDEMKRQQGLGINASGDFDQLSLNGNSSGDFDQLSLSGVDFGEDYTKKRRITPHTLESITLKGADSMDCGEGKMNLDGIPAGLGLDPDFGNIPQGLGRRHRGMRGTPDFGNIPRGLGNIPSGMGALPLGNTVVAGISIPNLALYPAVAYAAYWLYKKYLK